MAKKEIFIDTHLEFVYSPLTVNYGIVVDGGVADIQQFDQGTGQYAPDYEKGAYLILRPWMRIADPDGFLPEGPVQMTNMHWYARDTSETEITGSTSGYAIASDGRLSVQKNVDPGKTRLFRFTGEYQDPRTGEIFKVEMMHSVNCEAVSAPPKLVLNQPGLTEWDPTTDDPSLIVISADLKIGNTSVPVANRELIWEKKDVSDADFCRIYRPTDANYDVLDYDVEISADGTKLTLDRRLMGERVDIRCRAKYDPYGNPSSVTLNDRSPQAKAVFVRHVPVPRVVTLSSSKFDPTQKNFIPEAKFYVGRREITNPLDFWSLNWYMSKGVAAGTVSRTLVGNGLKPTIPTTSIAKNYGATLQTGVKEKDPLAPISHGGYVLTYNGAILLI